MRRFGMAPVRALTALALSVGLAVLTACASGASSADAGSGPLSRTASAQTALVTSDASAHAPCGTTSTPSKITHVVWIWMENRSLASILGSATAPYESGLAAACGSSGAFYDSALPNLPSGPNYLAYTSGGNCDGNRLSNTKGAAGCITTDLGSTHSKQIAATSVFDQVAAAHQSWTSYNEAMPSNCASTSSGTYAVRHNPAPFYSSLASSCAKHDVPFAAASCSLVLHQKCALPSSHVGLRNAISNGRLANFVTITPMIGNDMHLPGTTTQGDNWLSTYIPLLVKGKNYLAGNTAIFVLWDEGSGSKTMPAIVIAPSVRPGTRSTVTTNQIGVLWNTQTLLGLAHSIGCTNSSSSCPAGSTGSFLSSYNIQ